MPVKTVHVATKDPDEAYWIINDTYAPVRPIRFTGADASVSFELSALEVGGLHASHIRHTLAARGVAAPFAGFGVSTHLGGRSRWSTGGLDVRLAPGGVSRYPTGHALTVDMDGLDTTLLRVPMADVERLADEYSGVAPSQLRFDGVLPISESASARWRLLAGFVHRALRASTPGSDNPLIVRQLVDLIAATALAVFPNMTMTREYTPSEGGVAPAAVRRAMAYIEGHAREPVTLTDIADAVGTTGRAVQAAFRRHVGRTPMRYLRQVRLERAHRDLQAADPAAGATVAAVAERWGFTQAARFSEFYRKTFGVPPSSTLRS